MHRKSRTKKCEGDEEDGRLDNLSRAERQIQNEIELTGSGQDGP